MPELSTLITWIQSGEGRLIAAAVLFVVMWAVKSLPIVREHINTPRRKQAAAALLALAPAVWLMVEGAPPLEVVSTALGIVLAANGINTYRPSKAALPKAK